MGCMDDNPWRDQETLRKLYIEEDLSQGDIADRWDCSTATVNKWIKEYNITKEEPDRPWRDEDTMRDLYVEKDMRAIDIANKFDCGDSTVIRWIQKHGFDSAYSYLEKLDDEEWLEKKYWDEMKSTTEISDELGCSQAVVSDRLNEHGIETRKANHEKPVSFYTDNRGYEMWRTLVVGERAYHIAVHRLVMVAEHGVDAVEDMEVHHKNEIKWDNRPENLELMTTTEHRKHHCNFHE